jgi:hypothetical protein
MWGEELGRRWWVARGAARATGLRRTGSIEATCSRSSGMGQPYRCRPSWRRSCARTRQGSGRVQPDGRVFLTMLESPGWGLAGKEAPPRRHCPSRCHRATSSTPPCGASRRPSSPRDAAREALIPWALRAWQRRSGSLATSFLASGSPLLVQPGVDVAAPVARRPANLDECRPGPLLSPPF